MDIKKNNKTELVITHNPIFWLCFTIIFVSVNAIAGIHKILTTSFSQLGGNVLIGLPLTLILGGVIAYAFTRKARFEFNSEKGVLDYFYQSFSETEQGKIDLHSIEEIIIQSSGRENDSETTYRLAVKTKNGTIPLSFTYSNVLDYKSIKTIIDKWLADNKPPDRTTPTHTSFFA